MYPQLGSQYGEQKLLGYINRVMELENNLNFYDAKACLYA